MLRGKFLRMMLCVASIGATASLVPAPADGRGRSEQGDPLVFPHRRERLRSGSHFGSVFGHGHRGDLRAPAHLRLSRAPVEDRADGRRRHARGRGQRQDLHVQDHEGHLLRAGSGVQGQEARAHRPGLHLHVHAIHGSEESLAVRVPARRQDRRPGRPRREGQADRQIRLRRQGRRHGGRRPVHAALSPHGDRLQLSLRGGAHVARRGGARSHRSVRRRHDGAPGRHRTRIS